VLWGESEQRTAGKVVIQPFSAAVRFTDCDLFGSEPSSELLGYYQSSANAD
jgi:hypothetical protein